MTGTRSITRGIHYLQACFAWDYGNQSGQNLLSKSLRKRHFLALENVLTRPGGQPAMADGSVLRITKTLEKYARSSDLLYGIFPLCFGKGSGRHFARRVCAPLYMTQLTIASTGSQSAPALFASHLNVNRALLASLFDGDVSDHLATQLQALADQGPWGKAQTDSMLNLLRDAADGLTMTGFDYFPLLLSKSAVERCAANTSGAELVCAAAVYITKRSRQSMGVLHEMSKMAEAGVYSAPIRQLIGGAPVRTTQRGPLNILGALATPQRKAVLAARSHSLSVVHGPPGTGKTHLLTMLAADQLASGSSVLICARNDAAIRVIEAFLRDTLRVEEALVRGGSAAQLRELKKKLAQILRQGCLRFARPHPHVAAVCGDEQSPHQWPLARAVARATRRLRRIDRTMSRLAADIERHVRACEGKKSTRFVLAAWLRQASGRTLPTMHITRLVNRWLGQHDERKSAVIEKIQLQIQQRVVRALTIERQALSQLARSVTAREHNQRNLQENIDYAVVTQTLPIWICTLADLSHILPLQRELFDLVIIDEASQADIASAMPALQRAKRAVIVGDTCQLRHVSFLPNDTEAEFRRAHRLTEPWVPSYRNDSILDWANRQLASSAASSFLDEHFRSSPEIIEFSNREFYGGHLKLLTRSRRPRGADALKLVAVDNGRRGRNDINKAEANALLDCLADRLQTADDGALAPTIAVVSPFRAQANWLERCIVRTFSAAQIERHRIIAGTAHELQGEERDIVLFSACIDDDSASGSIVYLSREDVLNVAITRARSLQIIFLSRSRRRLDSESLFGRYIEWAANAEHTFRTEAPADTGGEAAAREISNALSGHPCAVVTGHQAGSVVIDIVLSHEDRWLGIDLVGFEGRHSALGLGQHELELMYRLNMPVIVVTREDWTGRREAVVAHLNDAVTRLAGARQ